MTNHTHKPATHTKIHHFHKGISKTIYTNKRYHKQRELLASDEADELRNTFLNSIFSIFSNLSISRQSLLHDPTYIGNRKVPILLSHIRPWTLITSTFMTTTCWTTWPICHFCQKKPMKKSKTEKNKSNPVEKREEPEKGRREICVWRGDIWLNLRQDRTLEKWERREFCTTSRWFLIFYGFICCMYFVCIYILCMHRKLSCVLFDDWHLWWESGAAGCAKSVCFALLILIFFFFATFLLFWFKIKVCRKFYYFILWN